MTHLLDTNICIYIINQKYQQVINKFNEYEIGAIGISTITLAELKYGAYKSKKVEQNLLAIQQFTIPLVIADFDSAAAETYGKIRANLERKGQIIGAFDLLITAYALSRDLIVVTNNVKEFERIEGLKIENWIFT
jgi:tRNA(fMet)-specific endonuclease VapC